MEPNRSTLHLLTDATVEFDGVLVGAAPTQGGPLPRPFGDAPPPTPTSLSPLLDDADGLIRALFACGFTSAAVQGRPDVGTQLAGELTALIDTLDRAISGIRHALTPYDAA